MTDQIDVKLWTSRKTGWILYPGIVLFILITVTAGFSIRIETRVFEEVKSQNLWSALISELTK